MPTCPSLSVIVEWDNARLSEIGRAREMLTVLRVQLTALEPAPG